MAKERTGTINISLPEALREFVMARAMQRYSSVSEYIRELVREDERRARQEKIEETLAEGLDQGGIDRALVREAIEGLRGLRQGLAGRNAMMTAEEIRQAVAEGRG